MQQLIWNKAEGELAQRMDVFSPQTTVVVPNTAKALWFENEKLVRILDPGIHKNSLLSRLFSKKQNTSIVFIENGDIHQSYIFKDIRCQENLLLEVSLQIAIRIISPGIFCFHLMREKKTLHSIDLKSFVFDELRDAINSYFRITPYQTIFDNRDFKMKMAQFLDKSLKNTIARSGLKVIQVNALNCQGEGLRAIQDRQQFHHVELNDLEMTKQKKLESIQKRDEVEHAVNNLDIKRIYREQRKQQELIEQKYQLQELETSKKYQLQYKENSLVQKNRIQQQSYEFLVEKHKVNSEIHLQNIKNFSQQQQQTSELKAEMQRRKYQAKVEQEICDIAMETQKRRAQAVLEIQRKKTIEEIELAKYKKSLLG